MITGSILNGLDFFLRGHFNCAMVFGSAGFGPNARDLFQMMHRVRDFIDEEIFFYMQACHQSNAVYLTTLESIRTNSCALLELQGRLRTGAGRPVKAPRWLEEGHLHNVWEKNLSSAYLDKSFTYWCEQRGYQVLDYLPAQVGKADNGKIKELFDNIRPANLVSIPCYDESIRSLHEGEVEAVKRAVYGLAPPVDKFWELKRYHFDMMIGDSAVPASSLKEVFNAVHTRKEHEMRFNNVHLEATSSPSGVLESDLQSTRVLAMTDLRSSRLNAVQQICSLLGLASTHDTSIAVAVSILETHQIALKQQVDNLIRLNYQTPRVNRKKGNNPKAKDQDAVVKLASNLSVVAFKPFSGYEFKKDASQGFKYCLMPSPQLELMPQIIEAVVSKLPEAAIDFLASDSDSEPAACDSDDEMREPLHTGHAQETSQQLSGEDEDETCSMIKRMRLN